MSISETNVVTFTGGRMTEADYERERQRLRETYGDSKGEAAARFDQELAALFYRSGWTQEQLAAKEGKSRQWIGYHIIFGQFLSNATMVANGDSPPKNLTERRFRSYWEETVDCGNDRIRFQQVIGLMKEDTAVIRKRRKAIGYAVVDKFADGKWHDPAVIAKKLDFDPQHVIDTLDRICKNKAFNARADHKRVGQAKYYRVFRQTRMISSDELTTELGPLVETLLFQGTRHRASFSPGKVIVVATQIKRLLEQWAKGPEHSAPDDEEE